MCTTGNICNANQQISKLQSNLYQPIAKLIPDKYFKIVIIIFFIFQLVNSMTVLKLNQEF